MWLNGSPGLEDGVSKAGSLQPFPRGSSWPHPEELVSHTGKRNLGILTERGLAPLGAGVGDDGLECPGMGSGN